jgi:hypothetical protein
VDFVPGFRHAQWPALMRLRGVYQSYPASKHTMAA